MDASVIDAISENIPALELFVLRCKELNKKRNVEDNERNVIEAAMALFSSVAKKDVTKFACASIPNRLETLENQTAEHVRRINQMSIELRAAVDEQTKLIKQVKEAKNAVVEEYRDALSQFREIMNNTDVEHAGSMGQFHTILEGVIREVINEDNNNLDTEGNAGTTQEEEREGNEFEALFQDQHVMEMFDRAFNTEDIMQQGAMQGLDNDYIEPPPMDDLQVQLHEAEIASLRQPTVSVILNYDAVPISHEEEEKEEEPASRTPPTPPPTPRRRTRRRARNTLELS